MRTNVSINVERATLKLRQTDALLAPAASAAVICSICSPVRLGGRPPRRPLRRAAASPATTRSRVRARSYWGRLREGAESYAKALASDILR